MKEFKSTYLCIKQHSVTGLRYLCKTTYDYKKMLLYKGSGKYWKNHLKIHGNQVETPWFCLFEDKEELTIFSLMCSEQWDIVKANDENDKKIWANEKPENGLDGGDNGGATIGMKFGPHSKETRDKIRKKRATQIISLESNIKRSKTQSNISKEIVVCPYCSRMGGKPAMQRWHFDNCKLKQEINVKNS